MQVSARGRSRLGAQEENGSPFKMPNANEHISMC